MRNGQLQSEEDAPSHSGLGAPAPGKRTLTDGLPVQRRAAPPILAHGPPAPGAQTLSGDQSFVSSLIGSAVQRKAAPADAKADADEDHRQPAQGSRSATSLSFAFFFTGGDAFGQAARLYVEEFYPDHLRFECRSFEHLFAIIDAEVPKAAKAARNERGHVDEIILVSHANAKGGMKIPLTDEQGSKKFTPWDVAKLQEETSDPTKDVHASFMKKRDQAMGMVDDQTRVVVRGCELGKSPEAMEALRVMFGGEATVLAPTEFQGFQIEKVGDDHRLKSWEQAHDEMVKNKYISADDLAELTPDELARAKPKGDGEVLRQRKAKYMRERFPDGIPSEFFVVGEDNYKAFKAMTKQDKLGKTGEAVKTRPGALVKPDAEEGNHAPYNVSNSDTRDFEDRPSHWTRARPEPLAPTRYDRRTHAEIIEAAEVLAAVWKPGNGGPFLRLYELWQLPDVNVSDPDDTRRQDQIVDAKDPVRRPPPVFSTENLHRAAVDEYQHPDKTRDSWHTQQLKTHQQLDFDKPADTRGVDEYDSEHIDAVSPDMRGESQENGFSFIGDDRLILWGFVSNGSSMAQDHAGALARFTGLLGDGDLVTVDGHTDSVGKEADNLRLSKRRAENVAAALIHRGVVQERVVTNGKGPSAPNQPETDKDPVKRRDARARNRRVELLRTPGWLRPGR